MQPYPRSPDLVWPGHLHGTGCLSARAVGTGFPTVVWRLCLGPVGGWVWVLLTPPVLVGVLGGCVWAGFVVLSLQCRLFVVFAVGLRFRPAFGTCVVCGRPACPPAVFWFRRAVWACVLGPGLACAQPFLAGLSGCVFFLRFGFFFSFLFFFPGFVVPVPPSPFFRAGLVALFFFFFFFRVPFPPGPLLRAWCCRFWVGGPPVPLWGSCLRCLLGGGLAACGGVGGRLGGCGLFSCLFPLPPPFFLGGGGLPVPPSAFPGLAHALACIQCCLPGCCLQLRSVWPRSGPMGRVGFVHGGLGAPSCRVGSWLCRLGGCARRLLVVLG